MTIGTLSARTVCALVVALTAFCPAWADSSVTDTIDAVVTRLYDTMDAKQLDALDTAQILEFLSDQERSILATRYWTFDVNVPVVVSVLRDTGQATLPFWLVESGFHKTDLTVTNMEEWTYEVWQKTFEPGPVELGINGFDQHRAHYLVGVGPLNEGDTVEIANLYPAQYGPVELKPGAKCYHDWGELVLAEVPDALMGHTLLTTVRGRSREAHLIRAFRATPFPSSTMPDQLALTWSDDPRTSQTVQWRTNTEVEDGVVRFRKKGEAGEMQEVPASRFLFEDRLLRNDRYAHRFTAVLTGLEPGTTYEYYAGSPSKQTWSGRNEFITAPDGPEPFTFVYFGDTHKSPHYGKVLTAAFDRHPETAFYTIGGDVVSTGLYRTDWDHFFAYSSHVYARRPIMPCIGNHDDQDGLGCWMYLESFGLPENGPDALEKERVYSFRYGNALVIALDPTRPIELQTAWLDEQLTNTDADWTFVMFHFPPYCVETDYDLDYADIRAEWGPVFDKHHVDIVLSGHVHSYLRTHPMKAEQVMATPAEGTIYIVSIALPNRKEDTADKPFAAKAFHGPALYQTFRIDGKRLEYTSREADGTVRDELVIEK